MDNQCVCCGAIIPEGRQVCPNCEGIKSAYCPLCNKVFTLYTNLNVIHCPKCNHHLNLKPPHHYDEDFSEDD